MNMRGVLLAGAVVLSCALATGRAQAQQQIFLEIPGVPGEVVTPAAFAGQIEVFSVSFGASNPGCSKSTLSVSDLNFTKLTDKASVHMWTGVRDHVVYATATLRFVRPDGQVYQKYELTNASFDSGQSSGSDGEAKTTESWSATFSQVVITYTFIDGSGKVGGTESTTIVSSNCPAP
jgi:type VI protein secretion system component Hcp